MVYFYASSFAPKYSIIPFTERANVPPLYYICPLTECGVDDVGISGVDDHGKNKHGDCPQYYQWTPGFVFASCLERQNANPIHPTRQWC
jgi:hypothetical protein